MHKKLKIWAALFVAALLSSCAQYQELEIDMFYKRDIGIEVNGVRYEGVTVIPRAQKYDLILEPKGDMDLILVRSCHREHSYEKQTEKFLWFRIGKNKFQYTYKPQAHESEKVCPLRVEAYESAKGRHSWALLEFEHPEYNLQGKVTCNGGAKNYNGVSVCQAKSGLIQSIKFDEIVQFADPKPDECDRPVYKENGSFEWTQSVGECLYHVRTAEGKMHRMVTIGYEGILIREAQ